MGYAFYADANVNSNGQVSEIVVSKQYHGDSWASYYDGQVITLDEDVTVRRLTKEEQTEFDEASTSWAKPLKQSKQDYLEAKNQQYEQAWGETVFVTSEQRNRFLKEFNEVEIDEPISLL